MSIDTKYLAKLLANGVSQAQSAAAVGCTPSYVSQLVASDPKFQEQLMEEDAKLAVAHINRTKDLTTIEKELMAKVYELVPYSESLGEATTALSKIAELKERRNISSKTGQRSGNVIELNLNKLADSKLEVGMGDNHVIVHLGGMNMSRAPSGKVKEMLQARKVPHEKYRTEAEPEDIWEIPEPNAGGM